MTDSESDQWLGFLSESEERLAELTDSPDPVAQRQIAEALYSKGKALSKLARHSEAVEVWDELLRRLALEPSGGTQLVALRVLSRKAFDLAALGEQAQAVDTADVLLALSASVEQPDRARWQILGALLIKLSAIGSGGKMTAMSPEAREALIAINEEIIRRFADSADPVFHEQVTTAIARIGLHRLLEHRPQDAVRISLDLAERFEHAPRQRLASEADLTILYSRALCGIGEASWRGIAEAAAFWGVNTARWHGHAFLEQRRDARVGRLIRSLQHSSAAHGIRVTPVRFEQTRSRIAAAIVLQETVTARIGSDPDPDPELQRAATIARIQIAFARLILGNLRQGWQELDPLLESSSPATVQALQTMAAGLRGRSDLPGQIDELATLSLRAQALGQGDTKIQQMAYEDSIRPLLADTTHRSVRWLAALLRPDQEILKDLLKDLRTKAKAVVGKRSG